MKLVSSKRRLTSGLTGAAIAALLLSGCATAVTPTESSAPIGSETDPAAISGDITFSTWWSYADQALVDEFEALYPNVNVTLEFTAIDGYPTKLQALAASGDLPDVFSVQGQPMVDLAKGGRLYDLQEELKTDAFDLPGTWGESFVPSLLSGANAALASEQTNGEIHGLPFNAISVASIYNQDIFNEVGIVPPTTYDELLANCVALSSAGYIPMSLTGAVWGTWWTVLAWDQTLNGTDKANFDVANPEYVKGLELVEGMAKAGCWADSQITTDIDAETSLFLQKKTAQFISVPENFLAKVAEDASFELGTYVLPALGGAEPNRILGGGAANVLAISNDSKNKAAAVAFAKFITSAGVQGNLASTLFTIPSINLDVSNSNPLMGAFLIAAGNGFVDQSTYLPAMSAEGGTLFNTEIFPKLILGQLTAKQAAEATRDFYDN